MSKPLDILDHNIEITQQYLSYIFNVNNSEVNYFSTEYILNTHLQNLFKCMKLAYEQEQKITINIVDDICKREGIVFEKENMELICTSFSTYDIIYLRKKIDHDYTKQVLCKEAVEDVFTNLTTTGDLDLNSLERFTDNISKYLARLQADENTSFAKKIDKYEEYYDKLSEGLIKTRTTGDPLIDKYVTYPGEAGDMLGLALRTGMGKTTIALNFASYLVNMEVPVIYFSLDMSERALITRFLCMREGLTTEEFKMENKPPELERKIRIALRNYRSNKHFILYSEPSASIKDIDKFIYKAKEEFKQNSVLDDEEYCVIIIDTLDIVHEFGGADAYGSLSAINKLHALVRKHKVFDINLLQINENLLRSKHNLKPEDIDNMIPKESDIWGSSAYSKRSRVMIVGERPTFLKMKLFPTHEDFEVWRDLDEDVLKLHCVKQNDGPLFSLDYIFDTNFYRIRPKLNK